MTLDRFRQQPSPATAWALVLALLLAQALGWAHSVAHRAAGGLAVAAALQGPTQQDDGHGHAAAVVGHDAGSPICQLFDQLGHADALLSGPALYSASVLVQVAPARPPSGVCVRQVAVYRARGPPFFLA